MMEPLDETDVLVVEGGALEANLGDNYSACTGGDCIDTYPPLSSNPVVARDNSVNVFVGGDYTVQVGAEAEGKVVVLGDFSVNSGSGFSDLGRVGIGSQVVPEDNEDALVVGGDITVDDAFTVGHSVIHNAVCLLYTSPSPRDATLSRMPSSA